MTPDDGPELTRTCAVAVMGKAPRSGRSKTRLAPAVGFEAAAALSAAFLRDTTENVVRAGRQAPIASYVAYAPADAASLVEPHVAIGTALLVADGTGCEAPRVEGFGRCLLEAVTHLLARGHASACVLNSDGPTLPTGFLVEAARLLALPGDRAVLGPSRDGGYYLLGLKRAHTAPFENISWSTADVAEQTVERAASIGLPVERLPSWYDVDDASALARLVDELNGKAPAGYGAPATRACLHRLGLDVLTGAA